jgi:alpha-ketoglutarate-dependent taurine dioxygenase
MKITNINPGWGTIIECSKDQILAHDPTFFKELGYNRDLVILRGLGKLTLEEHYKILSYFAQPWNAEDYLHSNEVVINFDYNNAPVCISRFSNKNSRLGSVKMPWHVDIGNYGDKSFPWRALYNLKNPNPEGGITSWLNLRLDLINPLPDKLEYYKNIEVVNQSWHTGDAAFLTRNPYIKTHPITGKDSLRSNYFVAPGWSPHAWIKETYLQGQLVDNLTVLGAIHSELSARPELVYNHQWELNDIIIYDNWNLMHKRTQLDISDDQERLFWRTNLYHNK